MSGEENTGTIIMQALRSDDMTDDDIIEAFALQKEGHDIQIRFLSEDEDDDSLEVMISWMPLHETDKGASNLHGHWRDVLKAKREGKLP